MIQETASVISSTDDIIESISDLLHTNKDIAMSIAYLLHFCSGGEMLSRKNNTIKGTNHIIASTSGTTFKVVNSGHINGQTIGGDTEIKRKSDLRQLQSILTSVGDNRYNSASRISTGSDFILGASEKILFIKDTMCSISHESNSACSVAFKFISATSSPMNLSKNHFCIAPSYFLLDLSV